ncbi:bZIP transcription factor 27-like [Wolffia australiana]
MWQQVPEPDLPKSPLLFSSSSASPSSSSPFPLCKQRTMEEVWKDITLNSASPMSEITTHQAYSQEHPIGPNSRPMRPVAGRGACSVQPAGPPPGSAPATLLRVNSSPDSPYLKPGRRCHPCFSPSSHSSSIVFCNNKKRVSQQPPLVLDSGDLRNKRMIKNRESAARSRARKQAYTNELEQEVNHLTMENERLRRLYEELRAKMAAQMSTKKAPQRSASAPF